MKGDEGRQHKEKTQQDVVLTILQKEKTAALGRGEGNGGKRGRGRQWISPGFSTTTPKPFILLFTSFYDGAICWFFCVGYLQANF